MNMWFKIHDPIYKFLTKNGFPSTSQYIRRPLRKLPIMSDITSVFTEYKWHLWQPIFSQWSEQTSCGYVLQNMLTATLLELNKKRIWSTWQKFNVYAIAEFTPLLKIIVLNFIIQPRECFVNHKLEIWENFFRNVGSFGFL